MKCSLQRFFNLLGTGNVLKIQSLLHLCSEYFGDEKDGEEKGEEKKSDDSETSKSFCFMNYIELFIPLLGTEKKGSKANNDDKEAKKTSEPGSISEPGAHQALAVLGIALIAMGEEIGAEMSLRTFNHLVSIDILPMVYYITVTIWRTSNKAIRTIGISTNIYFESSAYHS